MKVIGDLLRLVKLFWKWALLSILLGWATVASWVALIGTSSYLISYAALQPSVAELQVAIVGVRFFGISRAVFRYLERLVSHTTTFKILTELRVAFFERLEKIAPAGIKDYFSGDLLARIVDDIEILQEFYIRVIYPPFVAVLSSVGVLWFFGGWSLKFTGTIFAFQALAGVVVPLLVLYWSNSPGGELVQNGAQLRKTTVDGIRGIAEIIAFGKEAEFQRKLEDLGQNRIVLQRKMHWISGGQTSLIALLTNLCVVALLLIAVPMVNQGELDGKLLAVVVLGALASFEAVMLLPVSMQNIGSSIQAGNRLSNIFSERDFIPSDEEGHPVTKSFSIEVKNLAFTYPQMDLPVLQGVSLELPQGKKVGLVGVSGVGKSTLLNLLLRHWEFVDGDILLNGSDIRQYSPLEIRKRISVVKQQIYLFNGTVNENLLLGNPQANAEEVIEAAQAAGAHDFILSLPQGYQSIIGEQGAFISGGEAQRLGLARAILKRASVYLLDEPFAHLDPISRKAIMASTFQYLKDKSILLVTHQLSGLSGVDEVLLFDKGRVIERGSHEELVHAGGAYWQMWQTEQEFFYENTKP